MCFFEPHTVAGLRAFAVIGILLSGLSWLRANGAEALVGRWDFDGRDAIGISTYGGVEQGVRGPIAPEFPDMSTNNQAIRLGGNGARLIYEDREGRFQFRNGESITIEAWVRLDGKRPGAPMYVIGKGRTFNRGFPKENQNWSLRIVHDARVARVNFLFASRGEGGAVTWHRWASDLGFTVETGWHHVAVAYRFGDPKSIKGWVDGIYTAGIWDMGGETKRPPFVDDDEVWIGSALGGNAANSFRGWLDGIAVHRALLDDRTLAKRFKRIGGPQIVKHTMLAKPKAKLLPEMMPEIEDVPAGKVLVTLAEEFPSELRWRNEGEAEPKEYLRWTGDSFLLPRIPVRYDDWGIRAAWRVPLLVRMVADVKLPRGKRKFMLRTRALSRLWIDGQLVARGAAINKQPPNGEEPVTPVRKPPVPGLRVAGYHQQEVFGSATITNEVSRVIFETVVGGAKLRPETGEILVALQTDDARAYAVLRAGANEPLPLTDRVLRPELASIKRSLSVFDDRNRRRLASTHDAYWEMRHDFAKDWASDNPAPPVPRSGGVIHPVDAFIQNKIDRAKATAPDSSDQAGNPFHRSILPLLRDRCFRCHGEKEKGGLKLDSRKRLLAAVVPGDPHRSELIKRIRTPDEDERMPPTGEPLNQDQVAVLEKWITEGATWPAAPVQTEHLILTPRLNDASFLRKAYLDTVGVPPTYEETKQFLADDDLKKRQRLIRRLTADERGADHWTSYWQDMLAENPALLNQAQGATGPFRWFIHDSLRDNKPLDRMVTELIMLRGGKYEGGSAGFGMAAENDAPYAAKGHIVASAFLGIELQCARCHDAPYHDATQRDLYSLAAMFQRKSAGAPKTSQVPVEFFENRQRKALIQVTLKPGEQVPPKWRFGELTGVNDGEWIDRLMRDSKDSRERLATLITVPGNQRFARIVVNRIWKRLMGAGLIEPVHDWESGKASHPRLLEWLAHRFVAEGFNAIPIIRLIMNSEAYQRQARGGNLATSPESRFFHGPEPRRLTTEQIVDSLFVVTGNEMDIGELTFVHDGKRPLSNRQTLGFPKRAWMLADLNNERDRPSLSLPKARAVADVLEAFGWKGARQQPVYHRESEANVLQPGVLANGILVSGLVRAADESQLADIAVEAGTPDELVERVFLQILSRKPNSGERRQFKAALSPGFHQRMRAANKVEPVRQSEPLPLITWFNHLRHDANSIQQELERRVRKGPAADPRIRDEWRERFEDMVWSLINHREFVWMP